jgi:predicted nucleic acid-binding protein
MNNSREAVDTNVLIYLYDSSNNGKRKIAESILADNPVLSTQVISEYINVTRRLLQLTKTEILLQTSALFYDCPIIPVSCHTITNAAQLTEKYDFQIFDAIIVASALEANCTILYSEDMQHGLLIDGLKIINPFA